MNKNDIQAAVNKNAPAATEFLRKAITFPSTPGKEHDCMLFIEKAFTELGVEVERVPMSDAIKNDPDYSSPIPDITYGGRFNLRLRLKGTGGGKTLLFNAHSDVVPPSQGQDSPWEPVIKDGIIYGRGACDDKGPMAGIYLLLATLKDMQVPLKGDVVVHIVNEEENGGNGTLAMVRDGEKADACIVCEPSSNKVFTSVRGAVWFRVTCTGKAGHSGRAGDTVSALTLARKAMDLLTDYHAKLLASSKGIDLFDAYPNPMPLTFGRCHAGDWPATAPSRAVVEGVLGLLPNKTREQVMAEFTAVLKESGDEQLASRVSVEFMYKHDCQVTPTDHPLVTGLLDACGEIGMPVAIDAMTASCDSWMYTNQLNIPTVVFGPGTLKWAHSNEEQIALAEISEAAAVLTHFVSQFCA